MTRSLIRWNPAGNVQSRMSRLVDEAFNDFLAPTGLGQSSDLETWAPAVDIAEDEDAILFQFEMPGLNREDVELTLEDRTLTLRGERKFERNQEGVQYHRIERAHGTFSRSFRLPANVDLDAAEAKFDNGLLAVRVPKSAEAKPKRLEIR